MAITGRLLADFSEFQTAVQQAVVTLNGFQTNAGKVETSLNKMANSLSGTSIVQQATIAAEAVERIGGVSKLTETELQKVAGVASEAAAKLTALGQDVPAGIANLAAQAKTTTGAFDSMKGVVTSLAGAFGVVFSVGAAVQFTRQVIDAGSAIGKMAAQTGLSNEQVQKFQYIAGQTSVPVEALISAVQNLQQRLGDDSTGAAGAFVKLGINAEAFGKLSINDQILTLSDAFRNETDQNARASEGAALFGKTWKEIGPAILSAMRDIGNQAPIMSDATVKGLDEADKALKRFGQSAEVWGGSVVQFFQQARDAQRSFMDDYNPNVDQAARDTAALAGAFTALLPPTKTSATSLEDLGLKAINAAGAEERLTNMVRASIEEHSAAKKAIDDQAEALAKLTKTAQDHINSIADKLFGQDDIKKATDYAQAVGNIENVSHLTGEAQKELADVMQKGIEALVANGLASDELTSQFEALRLKATETARDAAAAWKVMDDAAKTTAADVATLIALQAAALQGPAATDAALRFYQNAFSLYGINHPTATPRAAGGATQAGEPYWVGEKGPELFVPSSNGSIIPNGGGGGGGTQVINLVVDGRVLASVVNDVNTRSMKQGRKWPAA